ncbi:MAG: Copper binding protein plastocyanin/azurin family [Frankiaceae bacterium]|nr:Copper binding protein plastocyanin/azurin family [Frankiaceae bacterium]
MPRTLVLAAAALVAANVAVTTGPATAQPARSAASSRTVLVQADNFRFCAATATICAPTDSDHATTVKVGTRVRWVYQDTACDAVVPCPGHDVVLPHGGTTKLTKSDGATIFTTVFRRAGSYSYFCSAHEAFGMTGRIIVKR